MKRLEFTKIESQSTPSKKHAVLFAWHQECSISSFYPLPMLAALGASRPTNTKRWSCLLSWNSLGHKENMQWFMNRKTSTSTFHSQEIKRCAIRVEWNLLGCQLFPRAVSLILSAEVRRNFNENCLKRLPDFDAVALVAFGENFSRRVGAVPCQMPSKFSVIGFPMGKYARRNKSGDMWKGWKTKSLKHEQLQSAFLSITYLPFAFLINIRSPKERNGNAAFTPKSREHHHTEIWIITECLRSCSFLSFISIDSHTSERRRTRWIIYINSITIAIEMGKGKEITKYWTHLWTPEWGREWEFLIGSAWVVSEICRGFRIKAEGETFNLWSKNLTKVEKSGKSWMNWT